MIRRITAPLILLLALAGAKAYAQVSVSSGIAGAKEPQAVVTAGGNVHLTFGAGNAIYYTDSHDAGKTFQRPVKVAEAGALSLGMRRGPRIAMTPKAIVITAVYGRQGNGRDGDLLAWRSTNGGKSWQGPSNVNDAPGAAREGLHGMTAAPDGTLACAWLDLRGTGTQLYAAFSRDNGATWEPNRLVYRSPERTICECCHPSLAFDNKGTLSVLWRNALAGNRDMYLCRSKDRGKTFSAAEKLGSGNWPLNACPMDGGGLGFTPEGKPVTAWRRGEDVYLCPPGSEERRISRGQQPWIASSPDGVYLAWIVGRPGRLYVLSPNVTDPLGPLAPMADDPVISTSPTTKGPVVVAWTGKDGVVYAYSLPATPP